MKIISLILFLLGLTALTACRKELKYSKEQLYLKAYAVEPSISFTIPKSMEEAPSCSQYPEGCLSVHTVQVKKLDLIAVEFMSENQAKFAAKKVRGYFIRNWLLDDVTGEPILEEFAQKSLEAKRP